MRIAMGIQYDGTAYSGWQRQVNVASVQAALEHALSKIADQTIIVTCAGRTDAGVHANGQVIHFDTDAVRAERGWIMGTNSNLPAAISVRWAQLIDENFHARYSAIARRYQYIIYNHSYRPSLFRQYVTWHTYALDAERMHEAAQHLLGEHDFSSFRGIDCQSKTPMRNLHKISVTRQNELIIIDVTANSFLHHMVRNIAGVLMHIGEGKREPEWAKEVLLAKSRKMGSVTAAPQGLYLVQVYYPEPYQIPISPAPYLSALSAF